MLIKKVFGTILLDLILLHLLLHHSELASRVNGNVPVVAEPEAADECGRYDHVDWQIQALIGLVCNDIVRICGLRYCDMFNTL